MPTAEIPQPIQESFSAAGHRPLWSATPTPFLEDGQIDADSVQRLIDHQVANGCDGVFLGGTCGEGPWMTDAQLQDLVTLALESNDDRIGLSVQATDNSSARVLHRIDRLAAQGVKLAVLAQPSLFSNNVANSTPKRILRYYFDIFDRSPLDIGFYDRGSRPEFPFPAELLAEIYAHPRVTMIKDSSQNTERMGYATRAKLARPELKILSGDEFACMDYLRGGYDGFMLGGAILNAPYVRKLMAAYDDGQEDEAVRIDSRAQKMLSDVYGGPTAPCWLAGLKYCLQGMGIFSTRINYLDFPFTDDCRAAVDRVLQTEKEYLFPRA